MFVQSVNMSSKLEGFVSASYFCVKQIKINDMFWRYL